MATTKENQDKMNKYFKDLAFHLNNALPENWYHVVLGSFYYIKEDHLMDNYQIYYQYSPGDDYLDLLKEFWEGTEDDLREDSIDEVSLILQDIHDYCKKCEDDWREMTFDFYVNGHYDVNFQYDDIDDFNEFYINMWHAEPFEY